MAIDPTFGRPYERFAQVGSFVEAVTPPAAGPFAGTLVALPCINVEWLRLLLGAATQLENPSSWLDSLSDSDRLAVVQQAQELRVGLAGLDTCVNPVIGASLDNCVLNLHMADGSTVPVTNWASQFQGCVQAQIPAPVTNPQGATTDQLACDIAGWYAAEIIQGAIRAADVQFGIANIEWQIATAVSSYLAQYGFVLTNGFVQAVHYIYEELNSGHLAHMQLAETDPNLHNLLTCAIYNAIKTDGKITAGNVSAVISNCCSISWVYPDVISTICNFLTNMGATGLTALQPIGALAVEDCSACQSTWCVGYTGSVLSYYWSPQCGAGCGTFSASAWRSVHRADIPAEVLRIISGGFLPLLTISGVDLQLGATATWSGSAANRQVYLLNSSGVVLYQFALPSGIFADGTKLSYRFSPVANVQKIQVDWWCDSGAGTTDISGVNVLGSGSNPSPANPCTF
jgi:hypothetical protein